MTPRPRAEGDGETIRDRGPFQLYVDGKPTPHAWWYVRDDGRVCIVVQTWQFEETQVFTIKPARMRAVTARLNAAGKVRLSRKRRKL